MPGKMLQLRAGVNTGKESNENSYRPQPTQVREAVNTGKRSCLKQTREAVNTGKGNCQYR